ncbi:MAG: hypothetical protein WCC04_06095 [Terriglobales bacterium]
MIQLSDYIGQEIVLMIPTIDPVNLQKVKLLGVEAGGVWIESQTLINHILKRVGSATAPRSIAFLYPYHELRFGFVGIAGPALNEKAFGV